MIIVARHSAGVPKRIQVLRGEEAERRRNHLIARSDTGGSQSQEDRVGSRRASHAEIGSEKLGGTHLKIADRRSQNVLLRIANGVDGGKDFLSERCVLSR